MKPLSLLSQFVAPNRVKTYLPVIGLDYAIFPTNILQGGTSETPKTDRFGIKIGPASAYSEEPGKRFGTVYPTGGTAYQRDQFRVQPFLQSVTFPGFGMSHLPDPAGLDGIRAEITAVFVNPISSGASTTLYDALRDRETLSSTLSRGEQPVQKVLAVGSFFGLLQMNYLPETTTREAWAGFPFFPFEAPDFARPIGSTSTDWSWAWTDSTECWFFGKISSIESAGQTITVRATNQESGFEWPRIPEDGTFEPSRGERIPLIYGNAYHFSAPILAAPYSSTLVSPIDDVQTDGIKISAPRVGLPPSGFIWIGGEVIGYESVTEGTGELVGVSRGSQGGTELGAAAFHNAGERVFSPGTTVLCLGDEGTSSVQALYVRTNQSNQPVMIPSSLYAVARLEADAPVGVGVPIRAAMIDAAKFQRMIKYYQRSAVARQVQYATTAGATITRTAFGPSETVTGVWYATLAANRRLWWDPRTGGSTSSQTKLNTQTRWPSSAFPNLVPTLPLDGSFESLEELRNLQTEWDRDQSGNTVFNFGFDQWQLQATLAGSSSDLYQGTSISAPTDWSANTSSSPGPSVQDWTAGNVQGWYFSLEPDTTNVSSISADWLYSVEFSYTLTVSALKAGTTQNFILAFSDGSRFFYDYGELAGDVIAEVTATEAGNITFNWSLEAREGVQVSDLSEVAFVVFAGPGFGSGSPDFTMKLDDGSSRNAITGTISHSASTSRTTVSQVADQSDLTNDTGAEYFWRGNPAPNKGPDPGLGHIRNWSSVGCNTFDYSVSTGELTLPSGQNIEQSTYQSWGSESFTRPWRVRFTAKPDFSQMVDDSLIDATTVGYTAKLKLSLTVPYTADDRFRIRWKVAPKPNSEESDAPLSRFPTRSEVVERGPLSLETASTFTFDVYEHEIYTLAPARDKKMANWDDYTWDVDVELSGDYEAAHEGRGFGFMGMISGTSGTGFETGSGWVWNLTDSITASVSWAFDTTSVEPPAQRESSPELTTSAIVANPGAFELEFFADASGPLASEGGANSPAPQEPLTPHPEPFQDLQAFDTDYGETSVVVNPTDILKRWIQRGDSIRSPGPSLDLFEANYSTAGIGASKNLNDHYNTLFRGAASPYEFGFDARNLGSDWESVLSRIAWESRTNVTRVSRTGEVSGSGVDAGMPFRLIAAGVAPAYSFGSSVAQLKVDEILAFDFLGKRATEVANSTVAFYDADDSRLGNAENPTRFRSGVDRPLGGRPVQATDVAAKNSLTAWTATPDVLSSTSGSDELTVSITSHGRAVGDWVSFKNSTRLGSASSTMTASEIDGYHAITEILDADSFKCRVSEDANETVASGGGASLETLFASASVAGFSNLEPTNGGFSNNVKQTGASTAFWVDFAQPIQGSATNAISFEVGRLSLFPTLSAVEQNSTFVGELSFRGSQNYTSWGTDGVTGSPTINFTDLGLGDPTSPGNPTLSATTLAKIVFDLDAPPSPDPSGTWAAFKAAWEAEDILGVRIELDSSLGSNASGFQLGVVETLANYDSDSVASANQLGIRPAAFQLEAHRGALGAEDWLEYMTGELAKDSRLVDVVVRTDAGWDLELGDVVTCDVPAQIVDEGVTPVSGTVQLRIIGVSRTEEGVALRGVVL